MSLETLLEAARFIELQERTIAQQGSNGIGGNVITATVASGVAVAATATPITIIPSSNHQGPTTILLQQATPLVDHHVTSTTTTTTTACFIPVVTQAPIVQQAVVASGVATSPTLVQGPRNIILTATPLPLRIKQVDHGSKQQIASNNHSGNAASIPVHGIINNSFDIINPLVFDDQGGARRKQPPLVFRSGTREVHNKLEKYRRAHLKECFDVLKHQLPPTEEKKTSNLSILHSALRHITALQKAEKECEQELDRLASEKIVQQQRLANLKKEFAVLHGDGIDLATLLTDNVVDNIIDLKPVLNGNMLVKDEPMVIDGTLTHNVNVRSGTTPPATSLATLAISGAAVSKGGVVGAATTVTINGLKESLGSATYVPLTYPVGPGTPLLLQKVVTLVPKTTPISFTTTTTTQQQQQANGNSAIMPQLIQQANGNSAAMPQLVHHHHHHHHVTGGSNSVAAVAVATTTTTTTTPVVAKILPLVAKGNYVMKPVVVVSAAPSQTS